MSEDKDNTARGAVSNIMSGLMVGTGVYYFFSAGGHIGATMRSISMMAALPPFTEMSTGFYWFVIMQALQAFMRMGMAAVCLIGIIAAQQIRRG